MGLTVARHALKLGDEGMARIAERVGYQFDTATSAAFKHLTGQSLGLFRLIDDRLEPSAIQA